MAKEKQNLDERAATTRRPKYGIRGVLPVGDPMRCPHLLGTDWAWERWYETWQQREQVFNEMTVKHPHYRIGDYPSMVLSKVER